MRELTVLGVEEDNIPTDAHHLVWPTGGGSKDTVTVAEILHTDYKLKKLSQDCGLKV